MTPASRSVLRTERDWFRRMAEDPNTSEEDRVLWRMLADELDAYLGEPDPDQMNLW